MIKENFSITKVRSRQWVKPAAVQPVVMLTRHWRGIGNKKNNYGRQNSNDWHGFSANR